MNYFLTRKSPTSAMVGSLLKTKRGEALNYYCRYCLRSHTICQNYVREMSDYIPGLKFKLIQNNMPKKKDSSSVSSVDKKINTQKFAKMTKLSPPKDINKRKIDFKKKSDLKVTIGALGWKNKYSVDNTKSYDPSLLNCSLEVEKFYKDFGKSKNFSSKYRLHSSSEIRRLEKLSNQLSGSLKSQKSNNSQTKNSLENINSNKIVQDISEVDMFKYPISKPIPTQPSSKSPQEDVTSTFKENVYEIDFNEFTAVTSPYDLLLKFLHSSLDICVLNVMVSEAYFLFNECRQKPEWKNVLESDPKELLCTYNTLLHALSVKGEWDLTKNVLNWMESDGVCLNSDSYAVLLCCLGNARQSGTVNNFHQEVKQIINKALMERIQLDDIRGTPKLLKPQELEMVLTVMREVVPNFEIKSVKTYLSSDCHLTKDLHLGHFKLKSPLENFGSEQMHSLVDEQLEMEKNFFVNVKAVSKGIKGNDSVKHKEIFGELKKEWKKALTEAVKNVQQVHVSNFSANPDWFNMHIYLNSVPAEKLVDILLETTLNLIEYSGAYSPDTNFICRKLGSKVSECYQIRKKGVFGHSDSFKELFKKYTSWYLNPHEPARNARQKWQLLIQESDKTTQLDSFVIVWPDEALLKVGKCLLDIILKEVKFPVETKRNKKNLQVLYTILRFRNKKYDNEIKCHPSISKLLQKIGFDQMCFRADEMPMLCPPKPWKSVDHGGYLLLHTRLVRPAKGISGKSLCLRKVPVNKMFPVFDSLNALQGIPWMINEKVLDVALQVFKSGGSEKLDVPKYPDRTSLIFQRKENLTYNEMKAERKKIKNLKQAVDNEFGLWCEALYKLSLAHHFRKRIFWMPQNCDFRGRVYPVPPLINHLGSDLFRSLLIFAKGKPLGPKGLDWMKIHLINLAGTHKKKSIEDRLAYANEILPEIIDSAEKPLTGNKWWVQSDDPWQTLATCMEIKEVLSAPNPEEYVSRLPIHQDGSCNGLQHYAALGKDLVGAKSVNLTSCEVPQDVYVAVAQLIEEERVKDAQDGVKIAKVLEGFIERKVVKQTIMTTVYGVTLYGAREQIGRRLQEIPDFPLEYLQEATAYLSVKTFLCLKKMFTSARKIQEWFTDCAGEICRKKDYVRWMTPLGLPVLQPYAKQKLDPSTKTPIAVVDKLKQKNAFPPNFIHSLDSCHMMLTALHCEQEGITFAAVHDCFWTHPCSVELMNVICREQFIALHSQPILEDLSTFFKKAYLTENRPQPSFKIFDDVPMKGNFDLKEVMNSVYFFS